MSGSGLIYAAVLGAWAVYFVSRSLRSGPREVVVPNEGVVLRRRGAVDVPPGSYAMIRPPSEAPSAPVVKQRGEDAAVTPRPAPVRVSPATAMRRRRVLALLAVACLVTSATTITHVTPAWTPALPILLVATYLLEVRIQTGRARFVRPVAPEPDIEVVPHRPARRPKNRDADELWDPWPVFEPVETRSGRVPDLIEGWEPRPVPLPTYVTAAKADPPARRIDISAGRAWTAAEPATEATAQTPAAPAAETAAETGAGERAKPEQAPEKDAAIAGGPPMVEEPVVEFEHKRAVND
ncbi:MAG TPA: hypothetical protein VHV82_14640 [Sporichthyaceae bacterium]|jgi:hypothetical protein|nr:hypothetical protein [Sporichthyaceae bacterium]